MLYRARYRSIPIAGKREEFLLGISHTKFGLQVADVVQNENCNTQHSVTETAPRFPRVNVRTKFVDRKVTLL